MIPKEMPAVKEDITWRMEQFFEKAGLKHTPKHRSMKTKANKPYDLKEKRRSKRRAAKLARRANRVG